MYILENKQIQITVNPLGAKLKSLISKDTNLEYMWQADPTFWAKTSPVLFPIVGGLKDNTYKYKGKTYTLPRHGFAREMQFELVHQSESTLVFAIQSDELTQQVYPFDFEFKITYTLHEASISVKYTIKNLGQAVMYFSVGAHPAFNVPLAGDLSYDDYNLHFIDDTVLHSYPLNIEGLVKDAPFSIDLEKSQLHLKKALFHKDALVLKDLKSTQVTLHSAKSPHGLRMSFEGFPYYGIWAARDADFICLEPWCGIADPANTNQELSQKEGINCVEASAVFERNWSIELF